MPKQIIDAAGLFGTPASVQIEVYDEESPGALLATIPNVNIQQIAATDAYVCNLKTITPNIGLPEDGSATERRYMFVWKDNSLARIPSSYRASGLAADQDARRWRRETPIYPSTTVPSRGITQNVIDAGKPSYIKVETAPDLDFASAPDLWYEVFVYDVQGRVASRTPSLTPPSP